MVYHDHNDRKYDYDQFSNYDHFHFDNQHFHYDHHDDPAYDNEYGIHYDHRSRIECGESISDVAGIDLSKPEG